MATVYWTGKASKVAQVSTATPANVGTGDVFTLDVGGETVSYTAQSGDAVAQVTAGLTTAWNNATHPYFTGITASDDGSKVTLTADNAGVPFTVTSSTTDGDGSDDQTLTIAEDTANAGPNDLKSGDNWNTGSVPTGSDDVVIADDDTPILWNLDGISASTVTVDRSYTGSLGLPSDVFTTSADGTTTDSTAVEYRQTYLKVGAGTYDLNKYNGPATPSGPDRLKVDADTTAATIRIHAVPASPTDTNRSTVRLLANSASTNVFVKSAQQGVGIATDLPDETSTISKLVVESESSRTKVEIDEGTTITTYQQRGGTNELGAAATITTVESFGGNLKINGSMDITTLSVRGGTVTSNTTGTISTLNAEGGDVDFTNSDESRSISTLNINGGAVEYDSDVVTIPVPSGDQPLQIQRA